MLNPFLKGSNLYWYIAIWILSTISQTITLYYYYPHLDIAITDSLVFSFIFAIIGLSYWYVVKFINVKDRSLIIVMFNHYLAALISIALWLGVGYVILIYFVPYPPDYPDFFLTSLPWRIFLGKFYYIVLILVYYLIIYYQNLEEKDQRETELRQTVKEAELSILKSQINPHFIFNALNSISYLTLSDPELAHDMIIKLSEFLRYSLKHNESEVTLQEEINNVFRYLEIEKIRFGDRLVVSHKLEDVCKKRTIPGMILQPIFENAIKHGVYDSVEPVHVSFSCEMHNDAVKIIIKNNFDPSSISPKGSGIGLKNIQKRLLLTYQRNDLLKINRSKNEFEVTIIIP